LRGGSSFESIRSEEINAASSLYFSSKELLVEKKWGRVFYPVLLGLPWKKLDLNERHNFLEKLIELEKNTSPNELSDVFTFQIFKKCTDILKEPNIIPWSKKEIKKNIEYTSSMSLKPKLKYLIKEKVKFNGF
jgi:hypothetical protein